MMLIPSITLRIGDPKNPTYSPPETPVDLPKEEAEALVKKGFGKLSGADVHSESDHLESIIDAIGDLEPDDFGKDGKPSVKAIEEILERSVSGTERDNAWVEYQRLSDDG